MKSRRCVFLVTISLHYRAGEIECPPLKKTSGMFIAKIHSRSRIHSHKK
jgi:hypothetical protein